MPSLPTVELDGRHYVMVEHETNQLVQSGNTVIVSRREVEGVVAKLERYEATNNPTATDEMAQARLKAYRELLGQSGDRGADARARRRS